MALRLPLWTELGLLGEPVLDGERLDPLEEPLLPEPLDPRLGGAVFLGVLTLLTS